MELSGVTFRYIGISAEHGEMPGICLCYKSRREAYLSFSVFQDYMTNSDSSKQLRVEFIRKSKESYSLFIKGVFSRMHFETTIVDIDAAHVEKIIEQLKLFTYYVIVAGYETARDFQLLPIDEYHVFKRDIYINGNELLGVPGATLNGFH